MSKATFTVTVKSTGQQMSTSIYISDINEGFWLSENDKELTQTDGLTKNCLFGQKVKIKLVTEDTSDGKEIEVEIKAKDEDGYISYTEDGENLKLILKVKDSQSISESFYLNPKWYNEEIENYNYETHQTEIEKGKTITFMFDAKYKGQKDEYRKKDFPKDDTQKLKPVIIEEITKNS